VEAKPFVKWAGGKRQLINQLEEHLPEDFNNYYEPFLGGGALFFRLSALGKIKHAYLNDVSFSLIQSYKTIKEKPIELITELKSGKYKNEKETFLGIRAEQPTTSVQAAARFIYLNKTAFNGLYRVNSEGKFNVPFGKYFNPKILDADNILAVSDALQKDELSCIDFEEAVASASKSDLIYFDPPYHPVSKTANFTNYTKDNFTEKDQVRLSEIAKDLTKRGCFVMLSNSYSPLVIELYKEFTIDVVNASRMINCKAEGRGKVKEVIVTNYNLLAERQAQKLQGKFIEKVMTRN
jgi:DNA adenine methylase